MQGTLTFNLPEEQNDLDLMLGAHRLAAAIHDYDDWLRRQNKHSDNPPDSNACRDQLHLILEDHDVSRLLP